MAQWHEPDHQCYGCKYNRYVYEKECDGCRRRGNTEFNTPEEPETHWYERDLFMSEEPEVQTFGIHKILVRK